MKITITALVSGYIVEVIAPREEPSLREQIEKQFDAERKQQAFHGFNVTATPPLHAFSTYEQVQFFVRDALGLVDPVSDNSANASEVDWATRDTRMSALNYAVSASKPDWGPADVLDAANKYVAFIKGEEPPTDNTIDKPSPDKPTMASEDSI